MRRWLSVVATVASVLVVGTAALAQTKSKTSTPAFDKLSLGNQRVAASLYEAQNHATAPTSSTVRPLTLDQIAAKRQAGQSWGQVFRAMKAQGLVLERSLSQVVSKYGLFSGPEQRTSASTSGIGKANAFGDGSSGSVDGASYGNGHGGK